MASTDASPQPKRAIAYRVTFPILDNTGALVTGATGLDSEISKDGGTFVDCTNEATEIATASGIYYLDLTGTEMTADTVAIIVKTSTTDAKTTTIIMYPDDNDINTVVNAINDDVITAAAISTDFGTEVAAAVAAPTAAVIADAVWDEVMSGHVAVGTYGQSTAVLRTGTAQGGAGFTITLDTGASASDDFYNGQLIQITGGTGAGQARLITDYTGSTKVADVFYQWIVNPDNTSQFVIESFDFRLNTSAIADSVWGWDIPASYNAGTAAVALSAAGTAADPWATTLPGAYGAGTAGSRIGRIPDVAAGGSGGLFIAGSNAATSANITGNITGNLSGSVGSVTGLTASNLDATVSSRLATAGYTAPPAAAANATAVWSEAVPGAYGAGTAGNILGNNLNATVSSRLAPTTAGRTLDVSAAGEAGIDWANIGAPTTSQTLSGTTVGTSTNVTNIVTANVTQLSGDAVAADNAELFFDGTGYNASTSAIGTAAAVTTVNGLAANVVTAAATSADFGTEMANAVWSLDATGQQTQGTFGQAMGDPTTGTSILARLPDASPGAAGGVFIAGTNAATTITTSFTTTFTGNLTGSVASVTGAVGSVTGLTAANLDATVSSRATQTSVNTVDDFLDTEIADIQARLPTALVSGRMDASVGAIATNAITAASIATGAIDADALAADAVDAILDEIVDGTYTFRQILRLCAAALGGKVTGAGTTTITFRNISDNENAIVATVDANGNRSAITLDLTPP